MVDQHLVILLVKLAVAASLASILTRFGGFQRMLMREERTLAQRVQMALVCAVIYGSGVLTRVVTHDSYQAVDLGLEGSLVMGMLGGYVTGLLAGVLISIPAMFHGELHDRCRCSPRRASWAACCATWRPDKEFIWRFITVSGFGARSACCAKATCACPPSASPASGVILLAEFMRYDRSRRIFRARVFALQQNWSGDPWWMIAMVYATTLFATELPIKIWNSSRNEKKLEQQQMRLNEARLAALSSQINPHFLFNTLNSVAALIRLNPEQARQVVHTLVQDSAPPACASRRTSPPWARSFPSSTITFPSKWCASAKSCAS